jgi:hypothetical protein
MYKSFSTESDYTHLAAEIRERLDTFGSGWRTDLRAAETFKLGKMLSKLKPERDDVASVLDCDYDDDDDDEDEW